MVEVIGDGVYFNRFRFKSQTKLEELTDSISKTNYDYKRSLLGYVGDRIVIVFLC